MSVQQLKKDTFIPTMPAAESTENVLIWCVKEQTAHFETYTQTLSFSRQEDLRNTENIDIQ